jgi:membrane protein YqaA with SNARE-associated domain
MIAGPPAGTQPDLDERRLPGDAPAGASDSDSPRPAYSPASLARPQPTAWQRLSPWLALLVALGISATVILLRDQLARFGAYGYPGLFLINLFASATLFLPVPGLALAFAAGSSLQPVLVGLATGSGSALGEITGYLAGFSGHGVIENQARYRQVQGWMQRYGLVVIFVLSLVPNPLFDMAGIIAGAMRIPLWKFLGVCLLGKVIKATVFAYAGAGSVSLFEQLYR